MNEKIYNRTSDKGKRNILRNHMTDTEIILWSHLKNKQLEGFKFRRQYSVGSYVLDFYCPKKKLAIEIDGTGHYTSEGKEYDRVRQFEIEQLGIEFIRFSNIDIKKNLYSVIHEVRSRLLMR